jgi:S-adenosyl-L-methionine hydrolase (adenosine-forming)
VHRTPEPMRRSDGALEGEVIIVDRFGNAVTNLIGLRGGTIELGARRIPVRHTYSEAASGEPVAVTGSTGFVEIAVRDGNAATALGIGRGDKVVLR